MVRGGGVGVEGVAIGGRGEKGGGRRGRGEDDQNGEGNKQCLAVKPEQESPMS